MAKRKKKVSAKAVRGSTSGASGRKRRNPKANKPWLKKDGSVRQNLRIAQYLKSDGTIDRRRKLPKGARSVSSLWRTIYGESAVTGKKPVDKSSLPWYNSKGEIKAEYLPYVTKAGTLRKRVKLPEGVKTIDDVRLYLESKKVRQPTDKRLVAETRTVPYWEVKEYIDQYFDTYYRVYMGGKRIGRNTWDLYGYDYVDGITNWSDSPPTASYTVAAMGKYKYLFV